MKKDLDTLNGGDGLPDWMQFLVTAGMFGMLSWILFLPFLPIFLFDINNLKSLTRLFFMKSNIKFIPDSTKTLE